jgi:hypothetical protein
MGREERPPGGIARHANYPPVSGVVSVPPGARLDSRTSVSWLQAAASSRRFRLCPCRLVSPSFSCV